MGGWNLCRNCKDFEFDKRLQDTDRSGSYCHRFKKFFFGRFNGAMTFGEKPVLHCHSERRKARNAQRRHK